MPEKVCGQDDTRIECCSLVQYSPDFLYILDTEGKILEINPNALQRLGYKKEELIGKSITSLFTPESQKEFPRRIEKLKANGYYVGESDLIKKNKEIINVECKATAYQDHQGEIVRIIVFEHDITTHKLAQRDIKESKRKLGERVKELNCLYEISELAREKDFPLDELFNSSIEIIIRAMQYPGNTCARIVYGNKEYKSENYKETDWKLSSLIVVDNKERGKIEVFYGEDLPAEDEGPFVEEERKLINGIAWQLSESIEYRKTIIDLKESRDIYQNLFENAQVGMFRSKIDGSEILAVNTRLSEIGGYSKTELLGMPAAITWADPEKRQEMINMLKEKGEVHDYEFTILTKNNELKEVMASIKLYPEKGYMEGSVIDITERKKAEEELRTSEEKYRILLQNLPQKIFIKDKESVYITCNDNYARDLGIKKEDIAGKTDYDYYPKELARKYRDDDVRVMKMGQPIELEEEYIENNEKRFVQTCKVPLKDETGQVTGIQGIFWDITDRKKAEDKLWAKTEELTNINKDLECIVHRSQADGKNRL
ncbi:PAS domain-containing protein [Candidatus Margulisiibacteriota bacterium]